MNIRIPTPSDVPHIARVVDDAELFPSEMLGEMMSTFFDDPSGPEKWLVSEDAAQGIVGLSFARAEPLTQGTWNLLAIGFRHGFRGRGHGSRLLEAVERSLADQRVLIVDTSGLDAFAGARRFYERRGYTREAVVREYWGPGDDKVIYRKALS